MTTIPVILLDMEVPPFMGQHMPNPLSFTPQKDAPPPNFPANLGLHREAKAEIVYCWSAIPVDDLVGPSPSRQ